MSQEGLEPTSKLLVPAAGGSSFGTLAATKPFLDRKGVKSAAYSAAALVVVALCIHFVVAVGWLAGLENLRSWLYGQRIGFATCFWMVLTCLGVLPIVLVRNNFYLQVAARVVLVTCLVFASILWVEHLFGLDFNTANVIYELPNDLGALRLPGPVPVDVSFVLAVLSLSGLWYFYSDGLPEAPGSVAAGASSYTTQSAARVREGRFSPARLLQYRPATKIPAQVLALLVALPSLAIVLAVAYGQKPMVEQLCTMAGCVEFKFLNYLSFFCLSVGLFLARPDEGATRLLFANTAGSRLFRGSFLALPISVIYVWLLWWAQLDHEDKGVTYTILPKVAFLPLSVVGSMIILGVFLAISTRKLEKVSEEKEATEQVLMALSQELDAAQSFKMVCLSCGKEFPDGWVACPYDSTELSRVADRFHAGAVFAEKYEIISALGAGGMSTVYKAKHRFLDKYVAIKLLNAHLSSDGKAVQRFQLEAKAAYDLKHPNLISIYDFGISPDGQAYIVMDYLEGESLSQRIERQGKLSLMEALPIFADVAAGLAHAHQNNVLHRDIKPSNVMLVTGEDGSGTARIVDFGLAKNYDENAVKLTQTGEIFGSPLYMSPEQCRGAVLDQRSDIYSFGCLMYETLTGFAPISGANAYETFRLKFSEVPPPFASTLNIPTWLSSLIMATLRVEPDERPTTASEIREALSSYVRKRGQ